MGGMWLDQGREGRLQQGVDGSKAVTKGQGQGKVDCVD